MAGFLASEPRKSRRADLSWPYSTTAKSEIRDELWYGAHSHHFNILGETGFLGAGLEWTVMAFVLLQMLRGLRHSRPRSQEQLVLVGVLAAYVTIVLGNFFYAYYTNDFVWFLMGCGWALSRTARREARVRARGRMMPTGHGSVPTTASA